jgi:hypothetical protein
MTAATVAAQGVAQSAAVEDSAAASEQQAQAAIYENQDSRSPRARLTY